MTEPVPLASEDVAILRLEQGPVLGHTCKVIVLGDELDLEEFREVLAERLEAVPELRRRLHEEDGSFFWVEDETFALENHLLDMADGRSIPEAELEDVTTKAFVERLDRALPLWQMGFVRLENGGAALIWRIHHSMADGATAMRYARQVVWDPESAASEPSSGSTGRHPSMTEEENEHRWRHLTGLFEREFTRSHSQSPFDGVIGNDREIAFATVSLSALHDAAAKLAGATLNDAVLSIIAASLRHWMELEHSDVVGDLRAQVPVSLHRDGDGFGNRDSFFSVPLHLDEPDPIRRLKEIREETWERKAAHDADDLDEITRELGRISGRLEHLIRAVEASPRAFGVSISNVKGPREAVTVLGSPVETVYTVAEIGEHHALRIAVISSGDRLGVAFCADPHLVRDLGAMAAGVEAEAALLEELARKA